MKNIAKILPLGLLAPGLVLGASSVDFGWINSIVTSLSALITALVPVVIGLGLLFFIWGLVQYIAASGDEAAKEEGKRKMIWGVIALFVIVAVWGLVALLGELVGVGQGSAVTMPTTP